MMNDDHLQSPVHQESKHREAPKWDVGSRARLFLITIFEFCREAQVLQARGLWRWALILVLLPAWFFTELDYLTRLLLLMVVVSLSGLVAF